MKARIIVGLIILTILTTSAYNTPNIITMSEYGNDELLDSLNAAIYNMSNSGVMETIFNKWFVGNWIFTDDIDNNTATEFPNKPTPAGTLDNIIQSGKIVFGADTAYPPFESKDINGEVIGYDVDVANAIATEFTNNFGVTIVAEMMTTPWDVIIPDLVSGAFDAILSAMTKTAERAQIINFTRSYFTNSLAIMAGPLYTDDGMNITTVAELNQTSVTVSVQSGTTGDLWALANLPLATIKAYDTYDAQIEALDFKDAHVTIADFSVLTFYSTKNPEKGTEILFNVGDTELFGIAVRKDTSEPVNATSSTSSQSLSNTDNTTLITIEDSDNNLTLPFNSQITAITLGLIPIIIRSKKKSY